MIPQYEPWIPRSYARAVYKQVRSGYLSPGKATAAFEVRIANLLVRATSAAEVTVTTSGTMALVLALYGLNLPKGSVVFFPAYTFLAGANAALFLGHEVELVDINPMTLCMDPDKLDKAIKKADHGGKEIGAVIFVNHNGYDGSDVGAISACCSHSSRSRIPMIEDASQGLGSLDDANQLRVGYYGDVVTLSFSVPKLITTGQGGAVMARPHLIERCRELQDHGGNWRSNRIHQEIGLNLRFNDVSARLGLAQFDQLKKIKRRRQRVWDWYRSSGIQDRLCQLRVPWLPPWMIMYRVGIHLTAESILTPLAQRGIQAVRYYEPLYKNMTEGLFDPAGAAKYPGATKIANELIFLPSSMTLTRRQVKYISKTLLELDRD